MNLLQNVVVVSGPVIIENGKVLLNRELKEYGVTSWLFPGGRMEESDESFESTCRREVKEEMGVEIEIIEQLKTTFSRQNGKNYVLIHYLAKRIGEIMPGPEVAEWAWHDIRNLPENCMPNVKEIIQDYLK